MINITLGVVSGSPSMKYPKNGFKIINITQIPEMNPARGFCFIVQCYKFLKKQLRKKKLLDARNNLTDMLLIQSLKK